MDDSPHLLHLETDTEPGKAANDELGTFELRREDGRRRVCGSAGVERGWCIRGPERACA